MAKLTKAQEERALAKAEALLTRSAGAQSKQPRFMPDGQNTTQFFLNIFNWSKSLIFEEPKYAADSRKRDAWLAQVVTKEPYLLGVLSSVVSIDKNRGWTLVGGRNQVQKFTNILHGFNVAPDLTGWRNGISVTAQSYYQSDLGAPVEIGRSQANGPLAALYTVDPTKCRLTGMIDTPLIYQNARSGKQEWGINDYFRVASFPNPSETMNGLGFCAVSRCIELAKLMVSVFEHDRERLGSKAPKGLLLINNITQDQWLKSLEESTAELKSLEREYYSGVQVLAGDGLAQVSAELVSLSTLPENFDHKTFVELIMFGYALIFGYDPREFWPVSSAAMGTATETQAQHRKATSKGGLDFALGFQEKLQEELPETLDFEFEQRDVEGDISEVALQKSRMDLVKEMYESANANGEILITMSEARQLLVENQLIPETWTLEQEDVAITDTEDMGQIIEQQRVQRAMQVFPDQDIVRYSFPDNKMRVIYKAGQRKFQIRMKHPGEAPESKKKVMMRTISADELKFRRAGGDYDTIRQTYWEGVYAAVSGYLESADRITSYRSAMQLAVVEAFTATVNAGYQDGGGELPLDEETDSWLTSEQAAELDNVAALFVSLSELRKQGGVDPIQEGADRAEGYANTLDGLYNKAVLYGLQNQMLTFDGDDGKESCKDCQMLKGQRHRASWWIDHDYVPPSGDGLACAPGGLCEHGLYTDAGELVTL